MKRIAVVVALGKIAFDEYLTAAGPPGRAIGRPKFGHGTSYATAWGVTLLGSYHPSQQNTFTGKLTRPMFHGVFERARQLVDSLP